MKKIKGIKCDALPQLKRQGELIYFDGPLLSHWTNDIGEHYFYDWVDNDHLYNRWIVFKASDEILISFFNKEITLRDVIVSNETVYIVDLDTNIIANNILIVDLKKLPKLYLPDKTSSYYQERSYSQPYCETFRKSLLK